MLAVKYPDHPFKIKEEKGQHYIFDEIRKKWLVLTPEEWVRQNFIQYLLQEKKYPASTMAVEKEISVGELRKRCDIVVYKNAAPWMIVECKEQSVVLNDAVIEQVLRYNIALGASYLVITNGNNNFAASIAHALVQPVDALPDW